MVKNLPAKAGDIRDVVSTPGLGRSPGQGHGNWLQYSCLENPRDPDRLLCPWGRRVRHDWSSSTHAQLIVVFQQDPRRHLHGGFLAPALRTRACLTCSRGAKRRVLYPSLPAAGCSAPISTVIECRGFSSPRSLLHTHD